MQKKPLPPKLKEKMVSKLHKEKDEQIAKLSEALEFQKKQEIEEISTKGSQDILNKCRLQVGSTTGTRKWKES